MIIDNQSFDAIKNIIYTKTGLFFDDKKKDYVSRRVQIRMEETGISSPLDYSRYLRFDIDETELEALVNLLITHETFFFRDFPQLQALAEQVLPVVTDEMAGQQNIRILSAGCSTGDEPYTLAIILKEMLDNFDRWNINIDAIDINAWNLEKAEKAIYGSRALKETPYVYRDRYFKKDNEHYYLNDDIKEMVNFKRRNLFNKEDMSSLGLYDIIFCRNVLIYFNLESAAVVLDFLHAHMKPGAFIFLGAAESVGRLSNLYTMERRGSIFLYRK